MQLTQEGFITRVSTFDPKWREPFLCLRYIFSFKLVQLALKCNREFRFEAQQIFWLEKCRALHDFSRIRFATSFILSSVRPTLWSSRLMVVSTARTSAVALS